MQTTQSAALRTMVARVSPDDIVIYANGALASYLDVPKQKLIGTPLDVVARRCKGEISSCFARPETGRGGNQLVTDDSGRVFEAKLYSDGGVLDIVLDEVTTAESIGRELRDSSGTAFESFSEEELRTTRHPERRYLTVTRTQLRGLSQITERLAPMEVRLMVNSFVEEACDAVFDTGCTVGETSGDSILGIFGAPRYFTDHPLRAIRAACEQMHKAAQLHAGLYREGKELPPCSCGLWTGDTLVGTLGNSVWQHYTAIGLPVDLAERLSRLARPGEILLPEHTLTHLLRTLPEGWQHVRAESEFAPDLSDFQWSGEDIAPMPEHLRKIVYLVGPGVHESTDNVEYYFDYQWSLVVPGREQPTPILRVVRPSQVGDSLELSDDNVVTTQAAQNLGKYKLIEVIGTGGMGKVWRGVDRFGNAVAIKVLHSSETVTEAQLKRFRREAEVMARLPHRNICRVYEMNEFDGIQFIAMEFVDGLTLSDLLYETTTGESSGQSLEKTDLRALIHSLKAEKSRSGQTQSGEEAAPPRAQNTRILPVEQTLSVILKVCDAVQFAHEHGVLHRDLKPGNILLREDGEPLVADFGLAKLSDSDATHSLSVSGHVVGTLENMSPEQAESSKDVDERADVYSIGTMLYQMLTGRRHFEATGNIVADAQVLKTHEPVRLRTFNSRIAPDLEIITLKALRNDTAERYRSVAALQADIEHYRRGEVISARPVSFIEVFKKMVQRNKGVSVAVAAALLIFVCGVVVAFYQLADRLATEREARKKFEDQVAMTAAKENEARVATAAAETEKAKAEKATREAVAATRAAHEATQAANAARQKANDLVEQLSAVTAAKEEATKAGEESAAVALRLAGEQEDLQKKIQEIQAAQKSPSRPGGGSNLSGFQQADPRAHEALMRANEIFLLSYRPEDFAAMDKNPAPVLAKLTNAMDFVAQALMLNPDFFPAWMLKGRLHLALMENARAEESFRQAEKFVLKFPGLAARDDPAEMLRLTAGITGQTGSVNAKGIATLRSSPALENQKVGSFLDFIQDKLILRKPGGNSANPLGRLLTGNEAALEIVARNGPATRVVFKAGGLAGRAEVIIWDADELNDLSPLKDMSPTILSITGAKKIHWEPILALPQLETLDLSKCSLESLPLTPRNQRGLSGLRSLRLAGTGVQSLDFIRGMLSLAKLDVSDTAITDLSPLLGVRLPLNQLVISGVNPVNLRVLLNLPLESLTLSPMLVTDKTGLGGLRVHRTLKVLRSPDDPDDQPVQEFWRKLASGAYETSH